MVNIEINNGDDNNFENNDEDYNFNEEEYTEFITSSEDEYDNDNRLLSLYEKQKLYFFMFRMACECISGILILLSMLIIIILWIYWMIKNLKLN